MRSMAQNPPHKTAATRDRAHGVQGVAASSIHQLQRSIGNQAVQRMLRASMQAKEDLTTAHSPAPAPVPREKAVEDGEQNAVDDLAVEHAAVEKNGDGDAAPAQVPVPAAEEKKAGVDSFEVKWAENASATLASTPTAPRLRLDYKAKFKNDAEHDPALAEFRQSVKTVWKITDGPRKGQSGDTSPMHDDNYSRADDSAGRAKTDVDFTANDNPGLPGIDKDDVLDYSFTAEQTIIDTSDANKVIAKRGPNTGTIKGKDPRTFGGVPTTLSA
jgi:hypothetical protein